MVVSVSGAIAHTKHKIFYRRMTPSSDAIFPTGWRNGDGIGMKQGMGEGFLSPFDGREGVSPALGSHG
jgi:hypothetical protein